ncbi:ABC transporter ATP-binding protein [Labrys miyagiensis]|uniref:ABC transporter ATP-binding protein n=1 Tax=Labrys miyagiensis TaxID=346912 RepID=A0ABQ6CMS5_9HYPH|nr:SbmA/BacA-like family transporter [Labrys miyagiensis]GLS21083.1 ABC transporter ATP-binding protein [Labrys miyagiensis]
MEQQKIPLKTTLSRFAHAIGHFAASEVGWKAKLMFVALVGLLGGVNGLNVLNSYVGRNFMTAITQRDNEEFIRQALFYVGVFAGSTVVAVIARFAEERLALLWREFVTRRAIGFYLADATYYRLDASSELANPDQRIAEDLRTFTVMTLSFVLMGLNSSFTVIAFSGVLWSISPLLFIVAVSYAACGSYLTIVLGRPLVNLNYNQLDKEASFRFGLIHIRENAEAIMLTGSQERQKSRLQEQLNELIANFRVITAVNRNVGFFTTGYGWLIQIIPILIIAPAFMRGDIAFGVVTQSAMAFSTMVAAFSLIITQFQSLSNFAAVVARLSSLMSAIEHAQVRVGGSVEIGETEGRLDFDRLTLLSPHTGEILLKDLSISIAPGSNVLVTGPNEAARTTLFRATGGVSVAGSGHILRPRSGNILFLAQQPYLPPGTLREALVPPSRESETGDERLREMLHDLDLDHVLARAGGLDTPQDWESLLSLDDRRLLVFVYTLLAAPQFAFLDRIDSTLGSDRARRCLGLLSRNSIAYLVNSETKAVADLCEAVLECAEDGSWTWVETRPDVQLTPQS